MKTAMQELIEDVSSMAQGLNEDELLTYFNRRAKELLETEKEQITEAYRMGKYGIEFGKEFLDSDDYFTQTFKTEQ